MTGLSVKTLSWALDEASGKATGAVWARDTWAADKYGRFCDKLLAALATKSKRLEALEAQAAADAKVVEAATYRLATRIALEVLPSTVPESATFDQLAEEVMELHLALRGKHPDTPSMELIEVAGIALNALSLRPTDEIDAAFAEWQTRHGNAALAARKGE